MAGIYAHPIGGGWSLRHAECADDNSGAMSVSPGDLADAGEDMAPCDGCGGPLCEPARDRPALRRARVLGGCGTVTLDKVAAYLPGNYSAHDAGGSIMIEGRDNSGWTLDGYVLPRLASGLIVAVEEVAC